MTTVPGHDAPVSSADGRQARHRAPGRRGPGPVLLAVLAVAAALVAAGAIGSLVGDGASAAPVVAPSPAVPSGGPTRAADGYPRVPGPPTPATAGQDAPAPVSLVVPAIGVDLSSLDRLGVDGGGEIEVPADPADAGWLSVGASPGATGPAVIAGHVDSVDGPAVFARLGELAPGDEIGVGLDDGTSVTYIVTGTDTYPKTDFPTEAVYGPTPAPVLRLITCGGTFDRDARSYEDNVVVYAALAG